MGQGNRRPGASWRVNGGSPIGLGSAHSRTNSQHLHLTPLGLNDLSPVYILLICRVLHISITAFMLFDHIMMVKSRLDLPEEF